MRVSAPKTTGCRRANAWLSPCYNRCVTSIPAPARQDPLWVKVAYAQAHYAFFTPQGSLPQTVIVAVSGGADSVCLLHTLTQMAPAWRLNLHVAHVDHGLRPQSAAESDFVAARAADYGLPFHSTRLDGNALRSEPSGLEAAARIARYTFLYQVAQQVDADSAPAVASCVAVAHHADDQAETVLLRLVQGSGLRGLGGLRPVGDIPLPATTAPIPVRLVRPLLSVARSEILAYLARHGLAWMEDESNADLRFTRNQLRHVVLPALAAINPGIVAVLSRNAQLWAEEADRLEAMDRAALETVILGMPTVDRVVLDLAAWQALAAAGQRGALRAAFAHLHADARQIGFVHIDTIVQRTSGNLQGGVVMGSGPHPLPGGLSWSVLSSAPGRPALLSLHRTLATPVLSLQPQLDLAWRQSYGTYRIPVPGDIAVGSWRLSATLLSAGDLPSGWESTDSPWRLFADAAAVGEPCMTTSRPGLRIAPLGMGGGHRRVVDVFSSHKIPPSLRPGWPILVDCQDGQVLWVCGLHPAESIRVTERTQQVVLFEWVPSEV